MPDGEPKLIYAHIYMLKNILTVDNDFEVKLCLGVVLACCSSRKRYAWESQEVGNRESNLFFKALIVFYCFET